MNKEEKLKKEQKAKEINKLKGLRIALIIFIIILLSLISFVGIYVKDKNEMSDIIPDFILGSDIEGNRIIQQIQQDQKLQRELKRNFQTKAIRKMLLHKMVIQKHQRQQIKKKI